MIRVQIPLTPTVISIKFVFEKTEKDAWVGPIKKDSSQSCGLTKCGIRPPSSLRYRIVWTFSCCFAHLIVLGKSADFYLHFVQQTLKFEQVGAFKKWISSKALIVVFQSMTSPCWRAEEAIRFLSPLVSEISNSLSRFGDAKKIRQLNERCSLSSTWVEAQGRFLLVTKMTKNGFFRMEQTFLTFASWNEITRCTELGLEPITSYVKKWTQPIFLNGPIPVSFLFIFVFFTLQLKLKHRCCAWDLNLGPQLIGTAGFTELWRPPCNQSLDIMPIFIPIYKRFCVQSYKRSTVIIIL